MKGIIKGMIYRVYIIILLFGVFGSQLTGQNHYIGNDVDQRRPCHFNLLSPGKNQVVTQGTLKFMWENHEEPDSFCSSVSYYEVTFWSESLIFGEVFTVVPDNHSVESIEFEDYRKIFRRHGKYFWKVTAYDNNGNQTDSEVWTFYIGIPEIEDKFTSWDYIYGIQFQYSHRLRTDDYRSFLENIEPNTHMRSFSDLSFIFHQDNFPLPFVEMEEKLSLLSQVGLVGEITSRIRALRNLYFSFCPYGSIASSWYSTGIRDYTSTSTTIHLGCDVFIMPRGYISFRLSWLPMYHMRYVEKEGHLRTFLGRGWEYGVRFIISHAVIKVFRFLGMEIDFQRIPLEFHFSRIRDEYSGTLLNMRRMSIAYLLQ